MNKPFFYKCGNISIDINNRGSGKTTAMVEDIVHYLKNTDMNIGYITPYILEDYQAMKMRIEKIVKNDNITLKNRFFNISNMYSSNIKDDMRIYIDDFIRLDELDERLFLRKNMYMTCDLEDIKFFNKNSYFLKEVSNVVSWRRKEIINKLLK